MSLSNIREFLRPTTLNEALELLREREKRARLLGGGIELVRYPLPQATTLIDLSTLPLTYVKESEGSLAIGATTTLREAQDHPSVASYLDGVIPSMLRQVASPPLRNLATVGGALVSANPWSDVITLFLALGAQVTLFDGEEQTIPLSELYPTGRRLQGAILTEVVLPAPPRGSGAAFHKFSRTGFDIAMLNCACFVQVSQNRCERARIVVGGTPRLAAPLAQAEAALVGAELSSAVIERVAQVASESADVREDRRASANYRKELVYVGIKRCLEKIKNQLTKAGR